MITKKEPKIDWRRVKADLLKRERLTGAKTQKALLTCVYECLAKAKSLSSPKIVFEKKRILSISSASIELDGDTALFSETLASFMKGATYIYLFLVTLGKEVETAATKAMEKGDYLRGYILDSIGSLAAESLAEEFEKDLRKRYASEDKSVSMRFSPGYCDWLMEEQFKLKEALDFSKAGVRLTEGCMMQPKKSITAIIGIGPKGLFSKAKSQCAICNDKDCDYRRPG